jgi:quercetin dioxygenase-like cupin family protein
VRQRLTVGVALVLMVGGLCGACGSDGSTTRSAGVDAPTTAAGPGTTIAPVVKNILAQEVDPPGAPGRTLSLVRYVIAPGAQLPAHIHPGVQLASIESGTLTYTIVSGTATVTRKGSASGDPATGPTTITLGPGDAVAENDGMVHYGANQTDQPVVILASLLTDSTKDLAVNVTTTTTQ